MKPYHCVTVKPHPLSLLCDYVKPRPLSLLCSLYLESMVDVEGVVSAAPEKITGCTQQDVEVKVTKVSEESTVKV